VAGHEPAISPAARGGPRMLLQPDRAGPALLDGGWWPRTDDPAAELPGLILALDKRHGRITRIMLGTAGWDGSRPHRLRVDGPAGARFVPPSGSSAQRPRNRQPARCPRHQRRARQLGLSVRLAAPSPGGGERPSLDRPGTQLHHLPGPFRGTHPGPDGPAGPAPVPGDAGPARRPATFAPRHSPLTQCHMSALPARRRSGGRTGTCGHGTAGRRTLVTMKQSHAGAGVTCLRVPSSLRPGTLRPGSTRTG
jgi:hypothetical protein